MAVEEHNALSLVRVILRKHGMEALLGALVEDLSPYEEEYLQVLRKDLETALENYRNRYGQRQPGNN